MSLTPRDVRAARFASARRGEPGYDEAEVDAFLDRVEATLAGKADLTAEEVQAARFTQRKQRKKRGYSAEAVDVFLDEVVRTLLARNKPALVSDDALPQPDQPPWFPSPGIPAPSPASPQRWDSPPVHQTGVLGAPQPAAFDAAEVDAYLGRIEATLAGRDTLTAHEVLSATFNPPPPGGPGYDQPGVQAFLVLAATSLTRLNGRRDTARSRAVPGGTPRTGRTTDARQGDRWQRPLPRRLINREPAARTAATATQHVPPIGPSTPPRDPRSANSAVTVARDVGSSGDVPRRPGAGFAPYDKDEVHSFLDRIDATRTGTDVLTAHDVLAVRFNPPRPGQSGYSETEFLALVAERLERPDQHLVGARSTDDGFSVKPLTAQEIRDVQLRPPHRDERGYAANEVDVLLERVEATLTGRDGLTAQQIHDVRFHEVPPGHGGYDQREVEALLGLIEDELRDGRTRRQSA